MQRPNLRHIIHIHRHKGLILLVAAMLMPFFSQAQFNYMEYGKKKYYFGITLGFNTSYYKVTRTDAFKNSDSIQEIHSSMGPGFNLGIIANLKLNNYFDLRFIPSLSFAGKNLQFVSSTQSVVEKKTESIIVEFPLEVRFKSQPIKDMRIYVLVGMKYSIDLAANAKARKADDQIRIRSSDVAYEYGAGIQFFFPLFIFSPEIKFSNGILNLHAPNDKLLESGTIDKLFSRTLCVSLHFEG